MSKYFFIVSTILLLSACELNAQEQAVKHLDAASLLDALRARKSLHPREPLSAIFGSDGKCGLHSMAEIHEIQKTMTAAQRSEILALIIPYSMQCDTVVGQFHIFYDTSGTNAPALLDSSNTRIAGTAKAYIDSVGAILNYVFNYEIHVLGYQQPPFEDGESSYRIFVTSQGADYGATNWDPTAPISSVNGISRYACWVELDIDFSNTTTKGMRALKVTAAHEFHHVIQIGSYGYDETETYAHELTSTWMETVVYPEIKDYFQYMPNYFNGFANGRAFTSTVYGGYERAVWGIFLAKQYGTDVMRDVWRNMAAAKFLPSCDAALMLHGGGLASAYGLFAKWNYFTSYRADTIQYYPDGKEYPIFKSLGSQAFEPNDTTVRLNFSPISSLMYRFYDNLDTMTIIATDLDMTSAESDNSSQQSMFITLAKSGISNPNATFSNGIQARVTTPDPQKWFVWFMQDSIRNEQGRLSLAVSPNPLFLSNSFDLQLPVGDITDNTLDVSFFSVSTKLMYSATIAVIDRFGQRVALVPVTQLRSKLASGIYIVRGKSNAHEFLWKVAVIR